MSRRWFQIHLSTAVVLMFVVSGLMWANTYTWHSTELLKWYFSDGKPVRRDTYSNGWPFIWNTRYTLDGKDEPDVIIVSKMMLRNGEVAPIGAPKTSKVATPIIVNVTTAMGIVCTVVLLCEWRIRRRERGRS